MHLNILYICILFDKVQKKKKLKKSYLNHTSNNSLVSLTLESNRIGRILHSLNVIAQARNQSFSKRYDNLNHVRIVFKCELQIDDSTLLKTS